MKVLWVTHPVRPPPTPSDHNPPPQTTTHPVRPPPTPSDINPPPQTTTHPVRPPPTPSDHHPPRQTTTHPVRPQPTPSDHNPPRQTTTHPLRPPPTPSDHHTPRLMVSKKLTGTGNCALGVTVPRLDRTCTCLEPTQTTRLSMSPESLKMAGGLRKSTTTTLRWGVWQDSYVVIIHR